MVPDPYEIRETPVGWEVRIDGIYQPCDPDLPGTVPMDNLRAYKVLAVFAERLGYVDGDLPEPLEVPL